MRNPTFVTLSDGSVRNTYDVRLRNKHGEERPFRLTIRGAPSMQLQIEGVEGDTVTVPADAMQLQRVYIVTPPNSAPSNSAATDVRIWVEDLTSGERASRDTTFNGREG